MNRFIYDQKRSHRCGSLRAEDVGRRAVLMGWVHSHRNLGGCVFVDLRDREGITQIVFDPQVAPETHAAASELRSEWVIAVEGEVRSRGSNVNTQIPTGAIEVAATRFEVLARAKTPPFVIEDDLEATEETRLTYRFLDLRRPVLQKNLQRRHRFNQVVRRSLDASGFLELETPFLIRSTPEGARDYVVPSRVSPGGFYALPQSPQLFKQLFMIAGYDRYFQIVRCFRDEDLRAERQPEFTQVDIEMSFCAPEDVQAVVEEVLKTVWSELLEVTIETPFMRITYDDAMARFGVDAPDLRFGLELVDVTEIAAKSDFKVFTATAAGGGVIKGINLHGAGEFSRKQLDGLGAFVEVYGAKGIVWAKVKADGTWQSPITKFLSDEVTGALGQALGLVAGDTAVFVADSEKVVNAALGSLRKQVAKERGLIPEGEYRFCWITGFPLFDWDEEEQRWSATHHPFTAPRPEDRSRLASDPGAVKADAYDVVLNGIEIGGGSIRIHDQEIQAQVFDALGMSPEEAREKFGFLLDALQYGAPPHGGIALGVDRIMMLICGTPSIRDVIAFPKTQRQTDLMLKAPAPLSPAQLAELSIAIVTKKGEGRGE